MKLNVLMIATFSFLIGCSTSEEKQSRTPLERDHFEQIAASPSQGFYYPYLLFVPLTASLKKTAHLLVEPNNTGSSTDDFKEHVNSAIQLTTKSYVNRMARFISSPLLVPIFPRSNQFPLMYTHSLDRDTLLTQEKDLQRLDLQLIAMRLKMQKRD